MQMVFAGKERHGHKPQKASRSHSKTHNLRILVQTIAEHGQISRADLARATGLTRASVSALIAELIETRWVTEAGLGESVVGKRPTMLELDRDSRDIVVVDLSAKPFCGSVVDIEGQPRFSPISAPSAGDEPGVAEAVEGELAAQAVVDLVVELLDRSDRELVGIGIACPGVIDDNGRVRESVPLGWENFHLADLVQRTVNDHLNSAGTNRPESQQPPAVQIINDAQAVALAVHRRLAGDDSDIPVDDLIAVRLASGIGAGIVIDGQLHLGHRRAAGEVAPLVKALMGRAIESPLDLGETNTVMLTRELGSAIGSAVGHLANVFDLSNVFLATEPGAADPDFERATALAADKSILSSMRSELRLELIEDDGLALRGAAAYLLQAETGLATG